jgi:uncharacterized protein
MDDTWNESSMIKNPLNRKSYNFSAPVDVSALATQDLLFRELIGTRAFQRMKSIRFLGAIDYSLVPTPNGIPGNVRYTRYQHSLGVAKLALLYASERDVSPPNRQLLYAAALLHDIGHAPLSHSLEPVFFEYYGLEHHGATKRIVTGLEPLGTAIYQTLKTHYVDIERLLAIISGEARDFDGFFEGPINFDTIEGILRSWSYTRRAPNVPSPEAITEAAIQRSSDRDRKAVDDFWSYKDKVYRYVINSRTGILSDHLSQVFMRRNLDAFAAADYFSTEEDIFGKLPGLKKLLLSKSFDTDAAKELDSPLHYRSRRFYISADHDFFAREDRARYRQVKHEALLMPLEATAHLQMQEVAQDLFDDDVRADQGIF